MKDRCLDIVPVLLLLFIRKVLVKVLAAYNGRIECLTPLVRVKVAGILAQFLVPLLADENAILERPDVTILFDFGKLHVPTVGQVRNGVLDDRPLARQVAPHVILVLLLCIEVDKLFDFHHGLPRLGQMTFGRLNLFTTLTLVPAHLHDVRFVEQVQKQTLKRTRLVVVVSLVDRLAAKHRQFDVIRHRGGTCRVIDALERTHVPEDNLVRIISRLDETHHAKRDSKFVAVDILSRPVFEAQLARTVVQLGKKVYETTLLF